AAAEIEGCKSKGILPTVKHFALNEQETHRSLNGDASFVNEQAMREIFLKPFEKAVKKGKTTSIMFSFNRIGYTWAGGDYRLLTTILREEWGFRGYVICDFNTCAHMDSRQMAYAGGDLNLATTPISWAKADNANDVYVLRKACKNILYSVANSNAIQNDIIGYQLPVWQITLYVIDGVILAGLGVWGFFAIRSAYKKKPEPLAEN
ncbi:MAG: glycoside hydrolase family 3 N-terminal domain-containing protein, partial [Bacilli bacterium]